MVQKPSHVKQLSPIHVCKLGLNPTALGPAFLLGGAAAWACA
jgi:hypothetical protein